MLPVRFYRFALLIDGIHKCISRLKFELAPHLGVKSVHIFWLYELRAHPEGLTAAELASRSMISRSLVSREIETLQQDGYIHVQEIARGKRKNYNSRIIQTDKGKALAYHITAEGMKLQNAADIGISNEELTAFYGTLEKIYKNLCVITAERDHAVEESAAENTI